MYRHEVHFVDHCFITGVTVKDFRNLKSYVVHECGLIAHILASRMDFRDSALVSLSCYDITDPFCYDITDSKF